MMKKIIYATVLFISITFIQGCSSIEKMSNFKEPFTEKTYRTDKDYLRGRGIGESPNIRFVEKLAEQDARARIAAQIEQVIQEFLKNYDEQYQNSVGIDFSGKAEGITRSVINQTLKNAEFVDSEKSRNKKNGNFRYYVVMQMPKEHLKKAMVNEVKNNVSDKERIRLDAKMKMLEEEMDNAIEKQNGNQ